MAMVCVNGAKECDGCMKCFDDKDGDKIYCEICEEEIPKTDDLFWFTGSYICEKCLKDIFRV